MKASDPAKDVLQRINWIIANLTTQSFHNSQVNQTYTFDSTYQFMIFLAFPESWNHLAQNLLNIETAIHSSLHKRSKRSLPFSSFSHSNLFSGLYNPFVYTATFCLDASLANIHDPESFVKYISMEIAENPLVGQTGLLAAACLGWPNLTAYHVEKYTDRVGQLKNKMLVIAETNNVGAPYSGSLATYEYIGEGNANLLVHDAFGYYGVTHDPNECTSSAIKAYFRDGMTR